MNFFYSVSLNFGIIAMFAGLIGVPLGSAIAQRLRLTHPHIDPEICGFALLFSAPMVYFALVTASYSTSLCYLCIFLGMASLNLTWSIVADILLVSEACMPPLNDEFRNWLPGPSRIDLFYRCFLFI